MGNTITRIEITDRLRKALRKAPQSLYELSERIGRGITPSHLSTSIGRLVKAGEAVKHDGRPNRYSKP